jgi:hypothetical protein
MVPGRDFYFSFSVSSKNILGSHWQLFPKNSENREGNLPLSNLNLTFNEHPSLRISDYPLAKEYPGGFFFANQKITGNSNPLA